MGGVQQYSYHYVLNMPHGSCIVLTRRQEQEHDVSEFDKLLRQRQQRIYRIPFIPDNLGVLSILRYPLPFFFFCRTLYSIVKKQKISHVIFAHASFFYFFSLLPLKSMYRLPFLSIFHGEDIPTIPMKSNSLFRYLINQLDGYVCNSHFTHHRLESFLNRKLETFIAYPGVEDKFFTTLDQEKSKQELGVAGRKVLYTVGRLDKRKGHDLVIRALPSIIEKFPDIIYLIGGAGPYETDLKKMVTRLKLNDYVKFWGFVKNEDIITFHNAGDIFVMPNRILKDGDTEGFGIVFLEAGAAGRPVIAGRAGGAVDAVIDGTTGFLIDPYSPEELIEKVVMLLRNKELSIQLGEQGKNRAWNHFRWQVLAMKFAEYLENEF